MAKDLKVLIAGAGRVGGQTAALLREYGHELTIVEADERRCEELSRDFLAMIVQGDAGQEEILTQARPDRQHVVAALTDDTATNRRICELARRHGPGLRTVARLGRGGGDGLDSDAVDEVVDPVGLTAVGAVNAIMGGSVRALESLPGPIRVLLIEVAEDAPVAGKRIQDLSLPRGALIISTAHGQRIAGPDTELEPGRPYIVAAESEVADEVLRLFHG